MLARPVISAFALASLAALFADRAPVEGGDVKVDKFSIVTNIRHSNCHLMTATMYLIAPLCL